MIGGDSLFASSFSDESADKSRTLSQSGMASKKKVVVAGAGPVGSDIVLKLGAHAGALDIVLIDPKNYFENPTASVRTVVDPAFLSQVSKPHAAWLPANATHVAGALTDLSAQAATVTLAGSGETHTIAFDYFVLATGHSYGVLKSVASANLDERKREVEAFAARIAAAQHVLLVGGGATGVEIAGEIRAQHPKKKITLITSAARVLDTMVEAASRKTMALLDELEVEVVLNERLELGDADEADTSMRSFALKRSGQQIEADFVMRCWQGQANTQALRGAFADALSAHGLVKVKPTLQFVNHAHMFAAGDVIDMPGSSGLLNLQTCAAVAVDNVVALVHGGSALAAFELTAETAKAPMMVTLGPAQGLMSMNSCCTCSCTAAANMKRDYVFFAMPGGK